MDAISAGLGRRMPLGLSNVVFAIGFALIPVTAGIAILRYRLYDIDRLINRTLVYAVLTVLLGLGYAVGVLVLANCSDNADRALRLRRRPWRWQRCSSRHGVGSKPSGRATCCRQPDDGVDQGITLVARTRRVWTRDRRSPKRDGGSGAMGVAVRR